MAGITHATQLRVSWIAARVHDQIREIGEPVAFARRLTTLGPVRGLRVTLPFDGSLPVDLRFWSCISELNLSDPMTEERASKLRRAGVPLRYGATLEAPEGSATLEAHLHPFGVVVIATASLQWAHPVPIERLGSLVGQLEDKPATIVVGHTRRNTTIGGAAAAATHMLTDLLTDMGKGAAYDVSPHRLATVISGISDGQPPVMPAANDSLHLAMHMLAGGGAIAADPAVACVPQWSDNGYKRTASSLLYMLGTGTSLLSVDAVTAAVDRRRPSTADQHRTWVLLMAHLIAACGLVRAANGGTTQLLQEWARTAADRLGRLFGPAEMYLKWGLVPRTMLICTGARGAVESVRKAPLTLNQDFPSPTDYP